MITCVHEKGKRESCMVKNNRSLFQYIVLTLITCGIYHWIFLYFLVQDVNLVCDGDESTTPGLLCFIIFSLLTCGIYGWYWYYRLGNRIAENAPRYNIQFQENGITILLWMTFGSLLFGLGFYVALYSIIKNMNALSSEYNYIYYGCRDCKYIRD